MRNRHILLGRGRYVHKQHLRHVLHHPNLKHVHGHGFNHTVHKEQEYLGEGHHHHMHKQQMKQIKPLKFKM